MARFSDRMVTEVVQTFWAAMQRGEFITDAAAESGTYRTKGARWLAAAGGVRPRRGRDLKGRCLSFSEREEIALGRAGGESMRAIAARLGRSPSTVSRELSRNAGCAGASYRATTAHAPVLARLNANGSLDSSFGNSGILAFPDQASTCSPQMADCGNADPGPRFTAVAVQPDGKILLAGSPPVRWTRFR